VTAVLGGVTNWTLATQDGLSAALAWVSNQAAPPNTADKVLPSDVSFNATVFLANAAITLVGKRPWEGRG